MYSSNNYQTVPPQGERHCKCKKSRCLKAYCECFAAGGLCGENCFCITCENNIDHLESRNFAYHAMQARHNKDYMQGCRCKKSRCLKKYCECFNSDSFCTDFCGCEQCENRDPYGPLPHGHEAGPAVKLAAKQMTVISITATSAAAVAAAPPPQASTPQKNQFSFRCIGRSRKPRNPTMSAPD